MKKGRKKRGDKRITTSKLYFTDAEKIHLWKRPLGVTTQEAALHIIIADYEERHKMNTH